MKREEKKNEKERVEQTDNDNTRQCVVQVVLKKKSVRLLAYRSDISSSDEYICQQWTARPSDGEMVPIYGEIRHPT